MADTKITQLATLGALADADLFVAVDDVGGSPQSTSLRADAFKTYIEGNANTAPYWAQTTEESGAGVTPVNYNEPPGVLERYVDNASPGVTNIYSGITAALSAYDYCEFGASSYLSGSTITLTANQTLRGVDWRNTSLTAGAGVTGSLIIIDDRCTVENMQINGTGTKGTTNGIKTADTGSRWSVRDITVNNFVNGINLQACWICHIDRVLIQACTDGIYVNNADNYDDPVNAINIVGGEIASCSQAGIHFEQGGGGSFSVNNFNIYGCAIEPSGTYGIWVENVGIQLINLNGVYFEACGDACYRQDTGISAAIFVNCLFDVDNNAATDKGIDITAGVTENITVQSSRFTRMGGSSATDGISLGASATVSNLTLISNAWTDSALGIVNDASAAITSINDEERGTRFAENVFIKEKNVATTDQTGWGQFWVKNNTPNRPRYTDDAGTDFWVPVSDGGTGGASSAGVGNQYVELEINGNTYKILHDGTV